jgi:SAM-dependent methyltransferase
MRRTPEIRMIRAMHDDPPPVPAAPPTPWARAFARLYDPFLWLGERAGVGGHRAELLGAARGRTVEIGAGTGLNLPHLPDHLDELTLLEPDGPMRARLRRRLDRSGRAVRILDAPAERLPFAEGSVDTVVSTFVLCTVEDPARAIGEIARVLREDGQLLLIEHVRSDSPRRARWQDRLERPWSRFASGCRCNQETGALLAAHGFQLDDVREASWAAMPPIVRPLIVGRARAGVGSSGTDSAEVRRRPASIAASRSEP